MTAIYSYFSKKKKKYQAGNWLLIWISSGRCLGRNENETSGSKTRFFKKGADRAPMDSPINWNCQTTSQVEIENEILWSKIKKMTEFERNSPAVEKSEMWERSRREVGQDTSWWKAWGLSGDPRSKTEIWFKTINSHLKLWFNKLVECWGGWRCWR